MNVGQLNSVLVTMSPTAPVFINDSRGMRHSYEDGVLSLYESFEDEDEEVTVGTLIALLRDKPSCTKIHIEEDPEPEAIMPGEALHLIPYMDSAIWFCADEDGDVVVEMDSNGVADVDDLDIFNTIAFDELPEEEQTALTEELENSSNLPVKERLALLRSYAVRGLTNCGSDEGTYENGEAFVIARAVDPIVFNEGDEEDEWYRIIRAMG